MLDYDNNNDNDNERRRSRNHYTNAPATIGSNGAAARDSHGKHMPPINQTPYELIGGESGVRRLVSRFYDLMDEREDASEIRAMHARSLRGSREKLFLYLSGWLGGPDLYQQKYGHPMLRRRHLPFSIGTAERDQWLACMDQALDEQPIDELLREYLKQSFFQIADHMRNRPDLNPGDHKLPIEVMGSRAR